MDEQLSTAGEGTDAPESGAPAEVSGHLDLARLAAADEEQAETAEEATGAVFPPRVEEAPPGEDSPLFEEPQFTTSPLPVGGDLEDASEPEADDPEEASGAVGEPVRYDVLRFVEVEMVLPSTHPVMVLEEVHLPCRRLHIPIGTPEGVAIAYGAKKIPTPKPLTHELFATVLQGLGAWLNVVRITGVVGSSYLAEIVVSNASGTHTFECRPSDAIAIALRYPLEVPIVAAPGVLDQASVGASGNG